MRPAVAIDPNWMDELAARTNAPLKRHAPLAKLCTFRIGGPADVLAEPRSDDETLEVMKACHELGVPLTILGGGSNVLIGDGGIRGCVLRLTGKLGAIVVEDGGKAVEVGAGASFARLTKTCMGLGWPRSNGWVGTPGTVGGAFIMNAGSREGEVGEMVKHIRAIVDDKVITLQKSECGFVYRNSGFPKGSLLLGGRLECPHADPAKSTEIEELATKSLLRRKASQPKEHSAGSIFKNPPGNFAGKLIEEAGLKGLASGEAQISPVHANFIVNTGNATAKDVLILAARAQEEVRKRTGVELEWEVKRIGEFT